MKVQSMYLKSSLLILAAITLFSCKKEDNNTPQQPKLDAKSLNAYVAKLPSVKQREPFKERVASSNTARTAALLDDYMPIAATKYYEQAKEYENQLLYADNEEAFFPGAMFKAKSVVDGTYNTIFAPRKPYTISVSLTGDKTSTTIKEAKLSAARDAISELLNKNFNAPPANITYDSYEVHDEQHLKVALGANYEGAINKVKGSVGFKYDTEKTRYIVKIEQVFYTIDVDQPEKPSDFFSDNFDYQNALGNEKPIYISSIKYGRVLLLGIESSLSKLEVESKINASFLSGKATVEAEAAYNELRKKSTITGRVYGGNAKLAGESIGDFAAIRKFLQEGATLGKDNLGVPLSYRMRELGSNQIFKTVIYSKYQKNDVGAIDNKKLDFDILAKRDNLVDKFNNKKRTLHYVINRTDEKGVTTRSGKLTYDHYYYAIRQRMVDFKKGESINIDVLIQQDKGGKIELTFPLPSFDDLVRAVMKKNEGHLYDLDKGADHGLRLRDTSGQYYLTIGIQNQKIR